MKCGIVNCIQNDNRFLWRCQGTCGRTYHAACIGVQRNHEDVLRTFMLPLCQDCQEKFTPENNLNELTASFENITENIGHALKANHKLLSTFKSLSATHDEALERIEKMLFDIEQKISIVTTSGKTSATEIKNKLSALLDTPPADTCMTVEKAVKSAATAAMEVITTKTSATAHSIDQLPKLIIELRNELVDSNAILASDVKSQMKEMAKTLSAPNENICSPINTNNSTNQLTNTSQLNPSWRMLGNKKVWKRDWTAYDVKQRSRRLQEKNEEKARRRRKQRKEHHQETFNNFDNESNNNDEKSNKNINNNFKSSNNNINSDSNNNNTTLTSTALMNSTRAYKALPLDKELLAAARVQFSRPPNTDNVPKFINFEKGETINPYRVEKPAEHEHPPLLDPMRPPIVRLTEQSATGDQRYLKARLRDSKIMDNVRTYLSFLHDQPPSVCIRGITKTSVTLMIAAEALPTDINVLREIYLDVHGELGISRNDALEDLKSYRAFLSSERTHRLQQTRDAAFKFYSPQQNFQRR